MSFLSRQDRRWNCDTCCFQDLVAASAQVGPQVQRLPFEFDFHFFKRDQITFYVFPFKTHAALVQTGFKFLQLHKRQERAEDVAADRSVQLMIDRPSSEHRLHRPEHVLHHPEFLVVEGDFRCAQFHVCGQYPDAVVLFFALYFFFVNGEMILP